MHCTRKLFFKLASPFSVIFLLTHEIDVLKKNALAAWQVDTAQSKFLL